MSSIVATIRDEVRDLLQGQSDASGFCRHFTAESVYTTTAKLEENDLKVQVAHGEVQAEQEMRGAIRFTVPITIAVRKTFSDSEIDFNTGGDGSKDEVDELVWLTEQIAEFMAKKVLSNNAATNGPANFVHVAPEDIFEEQRQFQGVVRVTFIHMKYL